MRDPKIKDVTGVALVADSVTQRGRVLAWAFSITGPDGLARGWVSGEAEACGPLRRGPEGFTAPLFPWRSPGGDRARSGPGA